ncbi:TPA: hypothetical protein EYP37_13065, partial [Candidatus Poribacteria bacterium]|nr:hypothetical protein [Candidatus Poribacteria bacterium]
MGTAVSVIFFISIIVTFLVALPLLILSSIHLGRAMWICPRCARKNVRSICRKCGFDRGSAARSEIQFIGEWGAGSVAFVLVIWGSLGVFLSGLVFGVLTGVGVDGRTASMLGDLQLYLLILALTLYIISFRYGKGLRDIGLNLKNIKLSLLIGVGITVVAWIVDVIYTNLMILTPLSKYIKKGEAEMELVKLLRPSDLNFWLFLLT